MWVNGQHGSKTLFLCCMTLLVSLANLPTKPFYILHEVVIYKLKPPVQFPAAHYLLDLANH